jgi:phosphate transport system substrate-binding protein
LPYHRSRSIIELARSVELRRTVRLRLGVGAGLVALSLILAGCGGGVSGQEGGSGGASGQIGIEGSSTVQPITQAVVEAYAGKNPDVQITVGGAGTGDGFEAFCSGDTQISDASRPIEAEEQQACADKGIEYIEIPIAYDGISVVVNSQNDFASNITSEELKTLWEPAAENKITTWRQVRSEWPDQQISLYGPGTESGTFDFFTDKINGEEGASRTDYQASEDDNVLVQGVSGDPNALGYFGFAYYENNQDTLKALAVDGVKPNTHTIRSAEYPLSRPLFIYVSTQALKENKAVEPFVNFYLDNLDEYVEQAKYVTLPSSLEQESRKQWEDRTTGTVFTDAGEPKGGDLEAALKESQ